MTFITYLAIEIVEVICWLYTPDLSIWIFSHTLHLNLLLIPRSNRSFWNRGRINTCVDIDATFLLRLDLIPVDTLWERDLCSWKRCLCEWRSMDGWNLKDNDFVKFSNQMLLFEESNCNTPIYSSELYTNQ